MACWFMATASSGHRAMQRVGVGALRQQREMFTDLQSGGLGGNWLKFTTNVIGCLRFHVERIVVRDATCQKDEENRLGFACGGELIRYRVWRHAKRTRRGSCTEYVATMQACGTPFWIRLKRLSTDAGGRVFHGQFFRNDIQECGWLQS